MPILLVNQTFRLVRSFKCFCFLRYALKGTGNVLFMCSYFLISFFVSLCSEDNVWSSQGSIFLVCFLAPFPSVPINGFIRNKQRVSQTIAQMWEMLSRELLPVWPTMVLLLWALPVSLIPHSGEWTAAVCSFVPSSQAFRFFHGGKRNRPGGKAAFWEECL